MVADPHPDSLPDADPDAREPDKDARSDIEQAVEARSDALEKGQGGAEPDGVGGENGAGGEVRNQTTAEQ